ncbi:glutathione S-transferase [Volucribacter psittacicida]|uniref:Glutathione S-transferase n=1 Tax=Volucribacter psittacicida TaxID=203482 RepID=A0A4R1G5B3_9PAST|nr:glutathione S-transferase C-terminal domain-containing protein [Volucribacter psittacicida]TCJ98901.1 glutathione S-transferase [Volucribacter psittacicida]
MLKLYCSSVTCALSPLIVIEETALPYQLLDVSLKDKRVRTDGSDYLNINPLGYVPALVLADGRTLLEGVAIIQYLADLVPEKQLAPANGSFERYQLQALLNYIATELPKNYEYLFDKTASEEVRTQGKNALDKHHRHLDQRLAQQPYLGGEHYSIADAYLYTVSNWARYIHYDLTAYPHLWQYLQNLHHRPAIQRAMAIEQAHGGKSAVAF